MDIEEARTLMLAAVERAARGEHDSRIALSSVIAILKEQQPWHDEAREQLLLRCWYDLLLTGVISWGHNFGNSGMQYTHLTEHGRKTLAQFSRDPANPSGYMALLDTILPQGTVARSYIEEGLKTYRAGCDKATAVMVGAASEAMALDLRDVLIERMTALGKPITPKLNDRNIKTILDAIDNELKPYTKKSPNSMPYELAERFTSFWSAFTGQLRMVRNDVGHPKSVDPVTRDVVHSNLIVFPQVAKLILDTQAWVRASYS
jgi:hypothetical protein